MSLQQIASILALLVGGTSIIAGGMVMRGWQPGWSVLQWLPAYNFVLGWLTLIPAYLLWINHRHAPIASISIFGIHAMASLLLLTVFRNTAAFQSIGAMSFRIAAWVVVLALQYLGRAK
jgi:hypothetical protein